MRTLTNRRRTPAWLSFGVMWLLMGPVFAGPAAAQGVPGCWTSSGDTWWTTIVLRNNSQGVCVVDPYGGQYAATIRTRLGEPVTWHVCNACTYKADVRLSNFSSQMTSLLSSFAPPADSSNSVTVRELTVGMHAWAISASATSDETFAGMHDYEVFVKLSSENETQWRQFHPQLQIVREGIFHRHFTLMLGGVILAAVLIGILLGRLFGAGSRA